MSGEKEESTLKYSPGQALAAVSSTKYWDESPCGLHRSTRPPVRLEIDLGIVRMIPCVDEYFDGVNTGQ
jgi:hypothetical protein